MNAPLLDMVRRHNSGEPSTVTHRLPLERFEEAWAIHREGSSLKVYLQPRGAIK